MNHDIHIRVPRTLHERVEQLAEQENVTIAEWMREAIRVRLLSMGYKPPFWNETTREAE